VREVLHKGQKLGREGLWELPGRGGKPSWKEEDIEFKEECLKNEPRTYNSVQLAQKLEKERSIKLSPDRLRRILKKKGLFGNSLRKSHKGKQNLIVREIKLSRPRYVGMGGCCGRNRLKIFG
jgi:transposase